MNFKQEVAYLRKAAKTKEQKYAVEQAAKAVDFRLRMESPFKKELKSYFKRQSDRIKRGYDTKTIEPELEKQYERVAKGSRRKVKNDTDDQLEDKIDMILSGLAVERAQQIDRTTEDKLAYAIAQARIVLAEDGITSPTDRQLRIVTANIFKSSNRGRVGTIALMETAYIDDLINQEARALSDSLMIEAVNTGDVAFAQEANRISPSLTGEEVIRDISIGASANAIKKKIDRRNKMWITMMDAKVRSLPFDHQSALFQKKPINVPFEVSGERLMEPRDTSMGASAGNVMRCRCWKQVL